MRAPTLVLSGRREVLRFRTETLEPQVPIVATVNVDTFMFRNAARKHVFLVPFMDPQYERLPS